MLNLIMEQSSQSMERGEGHVRDADIGLGFLLYHGKRTHSKSSAHRRGSPCYDLGGPIYMSEVSLSGNA